MDELEITEAEWDRRVSEAGKVRGLPSMEAKPCWGGSGCYVPGSVAVCPECGGELTARSMQWDAATGQPDATAIDIDCVDYLSHQHAHAWHQSQWQPVRDAIAKWCAAFNLPQHLIDGKAEFSGTKATGMVFGK